MKVFLVDFHELCCGLPEMYKNHPALWGLFVNMSPWGFGVF